MYNIYEVCLNRKAPLLFQWFIPLVNENFLMETVWMYWKYFIHEIWCTYKIFCIIINSKLLIYSVSLFILPLFNSWAFEKTNFFLGEISWILWIETAKLSWSSNFGQLNFWMHLTWGDFKYNRKKKRVKYDGRTMILNQEKILFQSQNLFVFIGFELHVKKKSNSLYWVQIKNVFTGSFRFHPKHGKNPWDLGPAELLECFSTVNFSQKKAQTLWKDKKMTFWRNKKNLEKKSKILEKNHQNCQKAKKNAN